MRFAVPPFFSRFLVAGASALLLALASARADIKLPGLFSEHMVLQRDQAVPVWGEAQPGDKITVKFRDQVKTTTANADGRWLVKLDPLPASAEPQDLVISGGLQWPITIHDVLVGEVWVGSGQSNMAMGVGWATTQHDPGMAALVAAVPYPQIRQICVTADNRWHVADNINTFSALLFSFGARLNHELGVPVGLILSSVSGSASSCWLSQDALNADPACQAAIKKYAATFNYAKYDAALREYLVTLALWRKSEADAKAQGKPLPQKLPPPVKPGEGSDGGVGYLYEPCIRPIIPYGIRGVLWDQGESGTALAGVDQYTLMGALISGWRHDWGIGDFPFIYVQKPSGGGCAWDPEDLVTKNAEPFAELPANAAPDDNGAAEVYNKVRIMNYPNTGLAISSDLGSGTHPINKSGYGHRAADVALGMVYGKKIEYYGPIYDSHRVEGSTIRVKFKHVGQGLTFRHGDQLQGFSIAGKSGVFFWAGAQIDGDTVVVSSDQVSQPVTVRYAWAASRPWANLFNKDGLPAPPFRAESK